MARSRTSRTDDPTTDEAPGPDPPPPGSEPADDADDPKPHKTCSDGTEVGATGVKKGAA